MPNEAICAVTAWLTLVTEGHPHIADERASRSRIFVIRLHSFSDACRSVGMPTGTALVGVGPDMLALAGPRS
jgi:hypothetical protein